MSTPEPLSKLVERWDSLAAAMPNGEGGMVSALSVELDAALQEWDDALAQAEKEWKADKTIVHTLRPLTEMAFVRKRILGFKHY